MANLCIAIDGPAGAGKSTISKIVAQRLNITYIDTGAMYRAVTLKLLNNKIDFNDEKLIYDVLLDTKIDFNNGHILLDEKNVSDDIRLPFINENVSRVSAMSVVRKRLVHIQRSMALSKDVIMDGRDIGTNVLKEANVKIYLTASIEERGQRRYIELKDKGIDTSFEEICKDIKKRDEMDMSRALNPLVKADDAVEIDTTGKSIKDVVEEILEIVKNKRCKDVL